MEAAREPFVGTSVGARLRHGLSRLRVTLGVWPLAFRATPLHTTALVVSSLLPAAFPPVYAWAAKQIIDAVVDAATHGGSPGRAARFVLLEFALVSCDFFLGRLRDVAKTAVSGRLGSQLTLLLLRHASDMSIEAFGDPRVNDRLRHALDSRSRAVQVLGESLQFLRSLVTLVAFCAMLTHVAAWMVALVTLASLPNFIGGTLVSKANFRLSQKQTPDSRELSYIEQILIRDLSAKEVKGYALAPRLLGRYEDIFERSYGETFGLARQGAFLAAIFHTFSVAILYGCYVSIVWRAVRGELSVGELTLYTFVLREWESSFGAMLGAARDVSEHALFTAEMFAFLADRSNVEPPPIGTSRDPAGAARSQPGVVEFDDVWFAYPRREEAPGPVKWALKGVTLRIDAGECVALVGGNGAGKSTFISLLLGFYTPTRGTIRIDGVDLRATDPRELRARFGVLFQDFTRFQDTVRENILYGDTTCEDPTERIPFAASLSGAEQVVAGLPSGYETRLGRWFDDGVELSGGQWQMVSLARAFMRHTGFLVLDEPTAALDPESEHELFGRLRRLMSGRTTLFVSHRMKTVRLAHRIVVLQDGEILESGSHDELIARAGRYAHLCSLHDAPPSTDDGARLSKDDALIAPLAAGE